MFTISDDMVAGGSKEEKAVSYRALLPRKTTGVPPHLFQEEIDRDGANSR